MKNAKEELLDKMPINAVIKEAFIWHGDDYYTNKRYFVLKEDYTEEDYDTFMNSLDFNYDNGFGGQEVYGVVVFTDGTWLERHEYDGSEWWEYKKTPDIKKLMEENLK